MQWTRDAYLELMTFGTSSRPMFCELFGPLIGLPEEWRAQGASQSEIDLVAFDWDYVPVTGCGANCGPFGTPPAQVMEETEEYRIQRDHLGRVTKLCKDTATIPLPLDFPVKAMEDWLKLKPYYTFSEARIDDEALNRAITLREQGFLTVAGIPGGFDTVRELMGEERACLAYYEQPELMHDILDTLRDTAVRVLDILTKRVAVDQVSVHEDMAGKSGPLAGPAQVATYIAPYYQACWDVASGRGVRLFAQDSDGNMTAVVQSFIDCGINVMFPCEPAAGMDMVALRERYGNQVAFLGGIDKHVLRGTKADIDRELRYKMQPLMREGGTVFALDHRIPNGTPLENYRYYVQRGRELLGLPPLDGTRQGWARMAF